MADLPPFAKEWLRQRDLGAKAVAEIEATELSQLTDAEALRLSHALLDAVPLDAIDESRRTWSGFVEQQRWFARARR